MRYKLLGRSGLRVSEICLGTMTFGTDWPIGVDEATARAVFDAFREAGGNFLDTANRYTDGSSEEFVGRFVAAERDRWVLGTKYTLATDPSDVNACGNHRKNLVQALEASLRRLRTDRVDVFWVHAWDALTPVEEVMRALDDQVRLGKVLYVGISDAPAWWIARANTLAELRNWSPFAAVQLKYSLLERTAERELLPMAQALDLAVTTWGSLGGGFLSGKYHDAQGRRRPKADVESRREGVGERESEREDAVVRAVMDVARELERPAAHVALTWVRQRPGVMIPVVGARTAEQLRENLGCLDVRLDDDQLRRLDEAGAIDLGFPRAFLRQDAIRRLVHGDDPERVDDHRRGRRGPTI
ncbi:MAG: aldo/keto reductase [Candidatus Krumholzibacteriia bacterium]